MESTNAVSKLIRLKRYEQPPVGYHQQVLADFRRRQRAALMRRSWFERVWDSVGEIWPNFQVPRMAYAALVAAAIGVAGFVVVNPGGEGAPSALVADASEPALDFSLTPKLPVTIGKTLPVSTRADGSQHYVLQPSPASNDRPLSF